MRPASDSKPLTGGAAVSDRALRRKHRKETSAFLWSTWIMLFLTVVLGHDTWEGFRTGQWVDLGTKVSSLPVPWWLAAVVTLGALLATLWCLREYVKLKMTAPKYQPGDEIDDDSAGTP